MTVKEMSQLHYLNQEIVHLKKQEESLEHVIHNLSTTQDCVQGSDKELFILHNIKVTGIATNDKHKWLEAKSELIDVQNLLNLKSQQLVYEYNRLNRFIQDCSDSIMRQALTFRFINGLKWNEVADAIGGNNTEDSIRKSVNRFFEKY